MSTQAIANNTHSVVEQLKAQTRHQARIASALRDIADVLMASRADTAGIPEPPDAPEPHTVPEQFKKPCADCADTGVIREYFGDPGTECTKCLS